MAKKKTVRSLYRRSVEGNFPEEFQAGNTKFRLRKNLRYGRNPGQTAAFYEELSSSGPGIGSMEILQENPNKRLSFINLEDADNGLNIVRRLKRLSPQDKFCAVIKHVNPCGVARGNTVFEAYKKAWDADSLSAFGSIDAFSDAVDRETAETIVQRFVEGVIAPDFSPDALDVLKRKKDVRVMKVGPMELPLIDDELEYRRVARGLLVQRRFSSKILGRENLELVSERAPTDDEVQAALFLWNINVFVRSNAVVLGLKDRTVGIGTGQMSRIDATKLAVQYAREKSTGPEGCVMASDAFFPDPDSVEYAGKNGITAIVYPLGSLRDQEVIGVANRYNISMLVTKPYPSQKDVVERAFSHM